MEDRLAKLVGTPAERIDRYRSMATADDANAAGAEEEVTTKIGELVAARAMCNPALHSSEEWRLYWVAEYERHEAELDSARAMVRMYRARAAGYRASAAIVAKEDHRG